MRENKFNESIDKILSKAIEASKKPETGILSDYELEEIGMLREIVGNFKQMNLEIENLKRQIIELKK